MMQCNVERRSPLPEAGMRFSYQSHSLAGDVAVSQEPMTNEETSNNALGLAA